MTSDYVNMKITATFPEEVSIGGHFRLEPGDQSSRSSDFLDQQMARHRGNDDTDGGSASGVQMRRSKSGDNISRNSEILNDDTKKILRDSQKYLLGASFET